MPDQPQKSWTPDWAIHPGKLLHDWMAEKDVRDVELATTTGLPPFVVAQIRRCQVHITPDIAALLAIGTYITAETWLRLQSMYNDHQQRKELGATGPDASS